MRSDDLRRGGLTRHRLDLVSLVPGLVFLAVAVVHIGARANDRELDLHWTFPVLLLLLGVVGLLTALRGPKQTDEEVANPTETVMTRGSAADLADTEVLDRED